MKLKAILCDFDGTLVNKENKYNPGTKELLAKIVSKNIHFSLATGRPSYGKIEIVLKDLNISDYHIFHGGGIILNNENKKILWKQYVSEKSVKKINDYFFKKNFLFALETNTHSHFSYKFDLPAYIKPEHFKLITKLTDFSQVLKIVLFARFSEEQINVHKNNLNKYCKDIAIFIFKRNHYGVDITSEKATKHTSVLEYERLLKIPRDQIVAIGDDHNDYPLFTACGYKIAMENAPKELKEIADFIAPPIEENGTVVALKHIINKFKI